MLATIEDDFDLDRIADSGQCFRWSRTDSQSYRIIAGDSCLNMTSLGDRRFRLDCTEREFAHFWRGYFDLQESYRDIRKRLDPERDSFLWQAAEHEKGIRILRQDPWEMLITFIISQNRNIPAIRRSVELLASCCGRKKADRTGQEYWCFPTPEDVAALSEQELLECRLGYRWKYVHAAAEAVLNGNMDLCRLRDADGETAVSALTSLYGVGIKVANCVSLFGLHHLDAFPVDVWMKRILAEQYPAGYPYERYSPYNGIYQQYMFAWYRHKAGGDV